MIKFENLTDFWQNILRNKLGLVSKEEYDILKDKNYQMKITLNNMYGEVAKLYARSAIPNITYDGEIKIHYNYNNEKYFNISIPAMYYTIILPDKFDISSSVEEREYLYYYFQDNFNKQLRLEYDKIFKNEGKSIFANNDIKDEVYSIKGYYDYA